MRIFFGGSIYFTLGRKKRKCTFKIKCMAGRCNFVGWSTKNIPGSLRIAETLGFVKGFLDFFYLVSLFHYQEGRLTNSLLIASFTFSA